MEYYVRECGDILGISSKLAVNKRSAKDVLLYVFQHIVECKKLNQASDVVSTAVLCHHRHVVCPVLSTAVSASWTIPRHMDTWHGRSAGWTSPRHTTHGHMAW